MSPKNQRLDARVLELGLFASRQAAQAAIMDGGILVDGEKVTKPGAAVKADSRIEVLGSYSKPKYVSRGGLKLEKALHEFQIDARDRICLDIGASTGGFTDCLLQYGAKLVYAIDVGYGQLDWKLRNDPRVIVHERVNARSITRLDLYGRVDQGPPLRLDETAIASLAVMDVSFISVLKILPALKDLLSDNSEIVCLIKPQFEAGKQQIGKGGVVRSAETHIEVIETVLTQARALGFHPAALTFSPIKGPAGNIEFLVHWKKSEIEKDLDVPSVVNCAHEQLRGL